MAVKPCWLMDLGMVEYGQAWEMQKRLAALRRGGQVPDTLLLVEHPPVVTIGRHPGAEQNLLVPEEEMAARGIRVFRVDRGGDVTYHGPGQLVGYPVLRLKEHMAGDLHAYLRALEEVLIRTLAHWQMEAGREKGFTGVWVGKEKVASIGVGVKHGVSLHGFALNVQPDLGAFRLINPCGLTGRGVTSLARLLGRDIRLEEVKARLVEAFADVFALRLAQPGREKSLPDLLRQVSGAEEHMQNEDFTGYHAGPVRQHDAHQAV